MASVPIIYQYTPIEDVRMLGGKLGRALQRAFNVTVPEAIFFFKFIFQTMTDLAAVKYDDMCEKFPNQAKWLWNLARGHEDEPVKSRNMQTSIAVSKNFPGKNALTTVNDVTKWVDGLSKELAKRLASDRAKATSFITYPYIIFQYKRTAENLVVTFCNPSVQTRTLKLNTYNPRVIYNMTWSYVKSFNKAQPLSPVWEPPILMLSLSAGRFSEGISTESKSILDWVADTIPLEKVDFLVIIDYYVE